MCQALGWHHLLHIARCWIFMGTQTHTHTHIQTHAQAHTHRALSSCLTDVHTVGQFSQPLRVCLSPPQSKEATCTWSWSWDVRDGIIESGPP